MTAPTNNLVTKKANPKWFAGAVSLQTIASGIQPWRVPFEERDLFETALLTRATMAAGVRLAIVTDSPTLRLDVTKGERFDDASDPQWTLDLLVDGKFHQRVAAPAGQGPIEFTGWARGKHRMEIYLPHFEAVRVRSLALAKGAALSPAPDKRKRWVCYGSSITQCRSAAGPSETWPALVARQFDLNLTCLGYGGQCQLDPMIARTIRDMKADVISLCLGINVQGAGSLSPRTFRPAVIGLIRTIRDGHPKTPIACVSPICSLPRETVPNAVGFSLEEMRKHVASAVELLRSHGDRNLHHVDGLKLFGVEFDPHMPDHLHPDAEGYRLLAKQYAKVVMPKLGFKANLRAKAL
ncbi:MAG: GDSL-type esterase/lipase family protein [Planctomycetota bacterium]|nr:GDSL-type esterase/lipase family protein [Planctomycetota bacterium]